MSELAMSSPALGTSRAVDWGWYALIGLGTIVAAVAANVIVDLLAGAVVAVLLYALLLRFAGNPVGIFTTVAAAVLVLSFIPDLTYIPTVPGATTGQTAVLLAMHLVAAAVIVGMLTNLARRRAD